jgi:hypothetical protein
MEITIYSSFYPFCIFARFLGFFPFGFEGATKNGRLQLTFCSIFFTLLGVAILSMATTAQFSMSYHFVIAQSNFFETTIWTYFLSFVFPIIFLQLFIQTYRANRLKEFIHFVHEVDLKFQDLNVNINHFQQRRRVISFIISMVCVLLARYSSSLLIHLQLDGDFFIFSESLYAAYLLYECFFALQFVVPTYLIRERFKELRKMLRCNKENFNGKLFNFNAFAEIFHDLCDCLRMINSNYTYHLIPVLLETLVLDIFGIYGTISYTITRHNYTQLFVTTVYIFLHFILKCSVAHFGSSITVEAEDVIAEMGKIINKLPPNNVARFNFYNLLKQFKTRNLKMQSFFLTANWNIVLAVSNLILLSILSALIKFQQTTSTIVTYLVIT